MRFDSAKKPILLPAQRGVVGAASDLEEVSSVPDAAAWPSGGSEPDRSLHASGRDGFGAWPPRGEADFPAQTEGSMPEGLRMFLAVA